MALPDENRKHGRARIKWPVSIRTAKDKMEGVTHNISAGGVYIRCSRPLRLNEVFDMLIKSDESNKIIKARAEVVWSNIYGPNDETTPRGMGVRFVKISGEDRKVIARAVMKKLDLEGIKPDMDTIEIALGSQKTQS